MKLSTVFAKLTLGKGKVISTLGGLAIVGAALTAATPAAKAQVAFGVEVDGPRYYAPAPRPVYVAPGYAGYGNGDDYDQRAYWEQRRAQEWRAQQWREQQWRQQQWREHEWREHEEREHRDRDFGRDRHEDRDDWR